ncbi:hypothetical protein N1851_021929 [Merluccius polli]|uniref:Uncharacterized protein n=1 Tax=Merluccius polli TaxID=89951 RepID=A0AA47NWB4_MERPO|nr:hypothetical protein N1851_021929 [Merluccius polli]
MDDYRDNVLTQRSIAMYLNNKPYISKEIKKCIVQKNIAFKSGDIVAMRNIQKELNHKSRKARRKEKEKFQTHCSSMNTKKFTCPRKATGPDGISGFLLKSCSDELAEAWCPIYQKWTYMLFLPPGKTPQKACCKENKHAVRTTVQLL